MIESGSPAAVRRWLAFELKHLRTKAGLSQQDVAKKLRCTVNKVAYIEKGQRPVKPRDLEEILLPLYEVAEDWREVYLDAAEKARRKAWWEVYDDEVMPESYARYIGLEQGAAELRVFQSQLVPGLLQTPEYAAAAEARSGVSVDEDEVTQRVAVRMKRQEVLSRAPVPLRLWAVLDEAALRRVVGDRETMRVQLQHLIARAEAPNVTLQVLPFEAGAHAAMESSIILLLFPWGSDPGISYQETNGDGGGARFLEEPDEVQDHQLVFEQVSSLALDPGETLVLLKEIGGHYS